MRTSRPFREADAVHGDMPFQHQRIVTPHIGGRLTYRHRAGNIGGAVRVLATAVDQVKRPALQGAIGGGRDAIMRQRAVRASPGNGLE